MPRPRQIRALPLCPKVPPPRGGPRGGNASTPYDLRGRACCGEVGSCRSRSRNFLDVFDIELSGGAPFLQAYSTLRHFGKLRLPADGGTGAGSVDAAMGIATAS